MPTANKDGVCLTDRSQIAIFAGFSWSRGEKPVICTDRSMPIGIRMEGNGGFKRMLSHLMEISVFALMIFLATTGTLNAGCFEVDDGWARVCENRADGILTSDIAGDDSGLLDYTMSSMVFDRADPYDVLGPDRLSCGEKEGSYLDRYWYYFADRWQYYYLDRAQYNLLGGFSYVLGHPLYPKLYERGIDQAVGFTGGVNMFWFGVCSYLPIDGGFAQSYYGLSDYRTGLCTPWVGGYPMFPSLGLRFYQTAGDYIDRWHYNYIDKGQYHYLDDRQYKLLGGLGYMYGRGCCGGSYDYARFMWQNGYMGASSGCSSIPEPATMTFLVLGYAAFLRYKLTVRRRNRYRMQASHNLRSLCFGTLSEL
jgi:hypothetical protein